MNFQGIDFQGMWVILWATAWWNNLPTKVHSANISISNTWFLLKKISSSNIWFLLKNVYISNIWFLSKTIPFLFPAFDFFLKHFHFQHLIWKYALGKNLICSENFNIKIAVTCALGKHLNFHFKHFTFCKISTIIFTKSTLAFPTFDLLLVKSQH